MNKSKDNLNKERIKKIFKNFDRKINVQEYSPLDSGTINPMYSVNTGKRDYVLRLCNPQWDFAKLEKEILVNEVVKENTDIPVPEIYFQDFSKKDIDFKYLIAEKLPGKDLNLLEKNLSLAELKKIFSKLGNYMGQLNSLAFNKFGDFYGTSKNIKIGPVIQIIGNSENVFPGPFENWADLFNSNAEIRIQRLVGTEFEKDINEIHKKIDSEIKLFEGKIKPFFVHGDFKPSNILISEGDISGVLDFEWALAGNREESFLKTKSSFFEFDSELQNKNELRKIYTDSYREMIPFLEGEDQRKVLYDLVHTISLMGCYKKYITKNNIPLFGNSLEERLKNLLKK